MTALANLRSALTGNGLDAKRYAPDLTPETRVARVAGAMATAQARAAGEAHISRPVTKRQRQLTRESVTFDGAGGMALAYSPVTAVAWDATAGEVVLTDPAHIGLAAHVATVDARVRDTRTGADISAVVQTIILDAGCDLIPVREAGGVYFLPSTPAGDALVTKLAAVLYGVGGRFYAFSCLLGSSATEDASLANAVTDYLLAQVKELRESVSTLTDETRSDVKQRRMQAVGALRGKMAAYANLLAGHAHTITDALDETEAELLANIGAPVELPLG
jgi:hypothetical protein